VLPVVQGSSRQEKDAEHQNGDLTAGVERDFPRGRFHRVLGQDRELKPALPSPLFQLFAESNFV
jgi:hypothetical protein